MSEQLGLNECVAIALGGMIGGGIYAVLGVVTQITRAATWVAFVVAGVVALCAGYSYNKLNARDDEDINPVPPAVGAVGALGFAPLMLYNLYTREPATFWMVLVLAVSAIAVELLYFEREELADELDAIETTVTSLR